MDTLYYILFSAFAFVSMMFIVVGFHEFGHYITARLLGIKVLTFSIGMGKKLFSYVSKRSGIEYTISALPIGGYVKMLDEKEQVDNLNNWSEEDLKKSFSRAPVWKRFLVVLNGPLFNLILAIAFLFIINLGGTTEVKPIVGSIQESSWSDKAGLRPNDQVISIDGKKTESWYKFAMEIISSSGYDFVEIKVNRNGETITLAPSIKDFSLERKDKDIIEKLGITPIHKNFGNKIGAIVENSPAHNAGLKPGNEIYSINGIEISSFNMIKDIVSKKPNQEVEVTIIDNGSFVSQKITLQESKINGEKVGTIGVYPYPVEYNENWFIHNDLGIMGSFTKAVDTSFYMVEKTFTLLKKMVTGDISPKLISGPVTMADAAGKSASNGLVSFLTLCAAISVNLMIINLLPIPALDGGHLAMYSYAMIFRKEVNEKIQFVALKIGMLLILSLMIFAIFMDISDFFM